MNFFKNKSKQNTPHQTSRVAHFLDDKTPFTVKEAFKSARTNLIFSMSDESKMLVVTSSGPLEGKTTISINLGITFAQTNAKVLLVDADLRKPRLSKIFNIKDKFGLTNLLRGFCTLEEAIHTTEYENLSVLPSGHVPPNPAEVLSSPEIKVLFDSLRDHYDYILIDTPPLNVVTDASIVSSYVDGVLLVVRQNITDFRSVEEAIYKLSFVDAKVLGFILNDINMSKNRFSYGYKKGYSRYGYRYYGSYSYDYFDHMGKGMSDVNSEVNANKQAEESEDNTPKKVSGEKK